MEIGKTNCLTVKEKVSDGWMCIDATGMICLMPNIFTLPDMDVGTEVKAFVYQDGKELRATTEIPYAEVGEYAVMECIEVLPTGAFIDWGIIKDLFVPYTEQRGKMTVGKRYALYVYQDEETGLITGTAKFKRNLTYARQELPFIEGQEVSILLLGEGDLGWNVVIEKKYLGLVYASEVFKKLYPLSTEIGYIKSIRDDGKIDVSLQRTGIEHLDTFAVKVYNELVKNNGILYLSDSSNPEEILYKLEMSKKNFKKAIGSLYKAEKIIIRQDHIALPPLEDLGE